MVVIIVLGMHTLTNMPKSIVCSVTNKHHAHYLLDCTISVYISMHTYSTYHFYSHIAIKTHKEIYSVIFTERRNTTVYGITLIDFF